MDILHVVVSKSFIKNVNYMFYLILSYTGLNIIFVNPFPLLNIFFINSF